MDLTVKKLTLSDPNPGLAAASAGGDRFLAEAGARLIVVNDDAAPHTVTIASQVTDRPGIVGTDLAVAVPAGAMRELPFGEHPDFTDGDGYINVTYDAVTSLSVAAVK